MDNGDNLIPYILVGVFGYLCTLDFEGKRKMKQQEISRLALLLSGIINRCEIITSKLRDGFLDETDYAETEKTIKRLGKELSELESDID